MNVLLAMLVLSSPEPTQVIPSYDPPAADRWEQSVTFQCGGTIMQVTGYGASRPAEVVPNMVVDGQALSGDAADALRRDLSNRRAVYRLGARCPRDTGSISLIIHVGEKTQAGSMIYRSGAALISGARVELYTGLQPANSETFWFR